ncbi:MAG: seg [Microgenomates group bacterium GW2011_GWC1_46_16]|uniref:Laminin G, sub domain 2 n=3 Tax=Candidatus Woeseibacteriota TaxID=1752722 RepID=A0A837I8W1_9BACT|nr:MAG: Laminin G, sub domain 2 [Candidatus Woesebacteria bacterium GW2011_GWB1_44_11]KKT53953.1 MAG: Laminin G, sub domain 2 [Candidatus Woesebacteria bacterium GW2011_GWA1_44_23]KKU25717.1 MAG: seg [Microgenomates group bacterium GW2011_GWC1_46_16]OGM76148.1 MAG: hypothetical protein A2208_00130 [Candidatus Woesebacteria bacterium RIFOXYA1_FULL_43_16]OGM81729.1 MAG: hypothetical protein A2394_02505 [Candidatus Woesebacteria bacterium RIFOXYB1_FULL_42_36]OGM83920.1 MAG: hypothetical protein A
MKLFARVTCIIIGTLFMLIGVYGTALADGVIPWEGQGGQNLPCEFGGHWVLAPALNIDSAILTVNGDNYTMSPSGGGSWSADSVGPLDAGLTAYVSYTGEGSDQNHLQLSHCTEGTEPTPTNTPPEPTPTSTNTPPGPTPTSTNTPMPTSTNTPGPSPTATDTPVPTSTNTPGPSPTATATPPEKNTAGGTVSGRPNMTLLFGLLGVTLILLGIFFPKSWAKNIVRK